MKASSRWSLSVVLLVFLFWAVPCRGFASNYDDIYVFPMAIVEMIALGAAIVVAWLVVEKRIERPWVVVSSIFCAMPFMCAWNFASVSIEKLGGALLSVSFAVGLVVCAYAFLASDRP